jgi:dTDP-4-dehydrorhamnose 3,5-epimerase
LRTQIYGCRLIQQSASFDHRGSFYKLYSQTQMESLGLNFNVAQINLSITKEAGTIRGMHYQKTPHNEIKLVRCIRGKIFDVVIDIRRNSPTYLDHQSFFLDEFSNSVLLVPAGCAHGFQVIEGPAEVIYAHSEDYKPEFEAGINPSDPRIDIEWPLKPRNISERDSSFIPITGSFCGVEL